MKVINRLPKRVSCRAQIGRLMQVNKNAWKVIRKVEVTNKSHRIKMMDKTKDTLEPWEKKFDWKYGATKMLK